MYAVGLPFWKLLARLGVPVAVRVDVLYDADADRFVGTSTGLPGLVCEAPSRTALSAEIAASLGDGYDPMLSATAPATRHAGAVNDSDVGFYDQVTAALKKRGFFFVQRGNGQHEIWSDGKLALSVPLACLSRHAANAVCRAAGAGLRF